jgi:DNA-binding CsgD family transcriptional regulator
MYMPKSIPVQQEQVDTIIALRKRNTSIAQISAMTGIPAFRISHIWRAYKFEALGIERELEEHVVSMTNDGLSSYEIAAKLGWSVSQIRLVQYRCRASGIIPLRKHQARLPNKRRTEITSRDYEIWRLVKTGLPVKDISIEHKVTRARIYQIIADVDARIVYWNSIEHNLLTPTQRLVIQASKTLSPLDPQ